jgi:hypothetical protein
MRPYTMPNHDDMTVDIAASVGVALAIEYGDRGAIRMDQTPAGLPVVVVVLGGVTYTLTVKRESNRRNP